MNKIKLEDVSVGELNEIFGPNEQFLQMLEAHFGVELTIRGDELHIFGEKDVKHELARVLGYLRELYGKGQPIMTTDVTYALNSLAKGKAAKGNLKEVMDARAQIGKTHKGKSIFAKTINQRDYFKKIQSKDLVFGIGPAGCGKTYLAVIIGVMMLKKGDFDKIVITRPVVEAGENLGFLPGDLKEKVDPYLRPLYDAFHDVLGPEVTEKMVERGQIEIAPLAYMRGRTLENAYVVLDEAQNTTKEQMKMFLTRLGEKSKMVVTGDVTQIDLPKRIMSGLVHATNILEGVPQIGFTRFSKVDVVRHPLVQAIIERYEEADKENRDDRR